jgi:hypothetical protein
MDFYLADPVRQQWDGLLTKAEVVEDGDFQHRQQLVHWVRSFPFAFLSDRDYIIGRQVFTRGETLYGISKVVKLEGHNPGHTVQMDQYWSMWSCKPVQCPFGSGEVSHLWNVCSVVRCSLWTSLDGWQYDSHMGSHVFIRNSQTFTYG